MELATNSINIKDFDTERIYSLIDGKKLEIMGYKISDTNKYVSDASKVHIFLRCEDDRKYELIFEEKKNYNDVYRFMMYRCKFAINEIPNYYGMSHIALGDNRFIRILLESRDENNNKNENNNKDDFVPVLNVYDDFYCGWFSYSPEDYVPWDYSPALFINHNLFVQFNRD